MVNQIKFLASLSEKDLNNFIQNTSELKLILKNENYLSILETILKLKFVTFGILKKEKYLKLRINKVLKLFLKLNILKIISFEDFENKKYFLDLNLTSHNLNKLKIYILTIEGKKIIENLLKENKKSITKKEIKLNLKKEKILNSKYLCLTNCLKYLRFNLNRSYSYKNEKIEYLCISKFSLSKSDTDWVLDKIKPIIKNYSNSTELIYLSEIINPYKLFCKRFQDSEISFTIFKKNVERIFNFNLTEENNFIQDKIKLKAQPNFKKNENINNKKSVSELSLDDIEIDEEML